MILETMQARFVVSGLSELDNFWNKLPKNIREDSLSIIEDKLNSSIAACHEKALEENGRSPRKEATTQCLEEVLKEFPEARLLVPDMKKFRDDIFIGLIMTAALSYYAVSSADYALLLLSVILILSVVIAIEKAFSCILVSTDYGFLEINFKRGTVQRMLPHNIKLQANWLDDACLRLNMPNLVSMPFQADKAILKQVEASLKRKELRF